MKGPIWREMEPIAQLEGGYCHNHKVLGFESCYQFKEEEKRNGFGESFSAFRFRQKQKKF